MSNYLKPQHLFASLAIWATMAWIGAVRPAFAQDSPSQPAAEAPPIVEWVYTTQWGYFDDWYKIFRKYQIAILDEEVKEGFVTKYLVQKGGGHVGESERWDLRVLIYYKDAAARTKARGIAQKLFPDQETFRKEEQQRWRLTLVHWDRPLTEVDPHAEPARN
ncbi:MAG: hypothetical protein ABSH42_16955 [Bryobacteraceae bacterium]|jgi:hypothetical protein